jgi:Lsr2
LKMAQRTIVQLTDDLDGKPIPDGKGETIRFSLDRTDYEIDLTEKNAKALRDTVGKYVAAARRTGGGSRGTRGAGSRRGAGQGQGRSETTRDYDPKAVRAWAESQGIEVSQRGRVPIDLIARFQEANA